MWQSWLIFLVSLVVLQVPSWQYFGGLVGMLVGGLWAVGLEACAIWAWTQRRWLLAIAASLAVLVAPVYQISAPLSASLRKQTQEIDAAKKIARVFENQLALSTRQLQKLQDPQRQEQQQHAEHSQDDAAANAGQDWLQAGESLRTELTKTRADLVRAYGRAAQFAPSRVEFALQLSLLIVAFSVLQASLLAAVDTLLGNVREPDVPGLPEATPMAVSLADTHPVLCERGETSSPHTHPTASGGPATPPIVAASVRPGAKPLTGKAGPRSLGPKAAVLFERMKRYQGTQGPRRNV